MTISLLGLSAIPSWAEKPASVKEAVEMARQQGKLILLEFVREM